MAQYSSQSSPFSSTPTGHENVPEFPGFSTQTAIGGTSDVNEASPNADNSTHAKKKNFKWITAQNLVLVSGWIKYGTNSIVGKNQKSESFWGKIAKYCNEHGSFDHPCDGSSCRNHFNYFNKLVGKWIGAYDHAKRIKQSGWSENDVLAKAHELYESEENRHFNYMSEWAALRDQPRYVSQVGGNTGSGSSGSKRAHEGDASDSNSIGSSVRPMGREAAKKKGKKKSKEAAFEVVNEDWFEYKDLKNQEIERLDKIAQTQEEANNLMKDKTRAKKMKLWIKLSEKDNLDDQSKKLFNELSNDLFGN